MGVKVEGMSLEEARNAAVKRCLLSTVMSVFRHIYVMLCTQGRHSGTGAGGTG